jgi:hypothetical protein
MPTKGQQVSKKEIFISLTKADSEIAIAISKVVRALLGTRVDVCYSTSQEPDKAIRHGEDWLEWIARRMQACDFALVLITPSSAKKPWILWEAGAVYGIAIASGSERLRRVRPVIYQVEESDIPSPLKELRVQFKRGDRIDDAKYIFREIIDQYCEPTEEVSNLGKKLDKAIQTYMREVKAVLVRAPLLEIAQSYLDIIVSDPDARIREKNAVAAKMGEYINTKGIKRGTLQGYDNLSDELKEPLICGLATAIDDDPQKGDLDLLLDVIGQIERLHVRYKILVAVSTLLDRRLVRPSEDTASALEKLVKRFQVGADDSLEAQIRVTRKNINVYLIPH